MCLFPIFFFHSLLVLVPFQFFPLIISFPSFGLLIFFFLSPFSIIPFLFLLLLFFDLLSLILLLWFGGGFLVLVLFLCCFAWFYQHLYNSIQVWYLFSLLVSKLEGSSQPMNEPITSRAQIQQENQHNPQKDIPTASISGDQGVCTTHSHRTPNT